MAKIVIDEDEYLTPVDKYFRNIETFSKEEAEKLFAKYNNSIGKLTEDFGCIDIDNKKLLVDTLVYFAGVCENIAKHAIDVSKKANKVSINELYTAFHNIEELGMSITNIYMADVMLNENKLFPDKEIDKIYHLENEAYACIMNAVILITGNELIERSYIIQKTSEEIHNAKKEISQEEASEYYALQRVCKRHPYYTIKAMAFEEKYQHQFLEETKSWQEMNVELFEKEKTKEEIIKEMLMPINSYEQQIEFMKYLYKEYEYYIENREKNMKEAMLALCDVAEYRLSQLIAKIASLTEEDSLKATMLCACKNYHDQIMSGYESIEKKFRDVYHTEEGDAFFKAKSHLDDISMDFRTTYSTQIALFPDIKEKCKAQDEIRNEIHKKYPLGIIGCRFQDDTEYRELWDKIRQLESEMDDLLDEYVKQENRGRDLFI